jgi:hypothetical protein
MSGDENDGDVGARFAQSALELKAANPGKAYVKNEATGAIVGYALQKILPGSERFGLQSHAPEHALHRRAHTWIIVDDKHQRDC